MSFLSGIGHAIGSVAHAVEDGDKRFAQALDRAAVGTAHVAEEARHAIRKISPSDFGHTALDALGMVPVVGTVANLANAGWYAAQGDWKDAAWSASAAVPIGGEALDAAKMIRDGMKFGEDAAQAAKAAETGAKIAEGAEGAAKAGGGAGNSVKGFKAVKEPRPRWQDSEQHVAERTSDQNSVQQKSFKDGKELKKVGPHWPKPEGSVRPDTHIDGKDLKYSKAGTPGLSIEVKNYRVTTKKGVKRLTDKLIDQAEKRDVHLPKGTIQQVVIDVRGQNVSLRKLQKLRASIAEESGGILDPANIRFIRNPEIPEDLREQVARYTQP